VRTTVVSNLRRKQNGTYKNDPNRLDEFTKYPASWLNADSWENGPLPEDSRAKKLRDKTEQEKIMKEWGNESE
jgi:hypothetical protein